jgi:Domain of unknown function (DUF1844)
MPELQNHDHSDAESVFEEINDLADIPAVEVVGRYFVELLNLAAVHCGLSEDGRPADLDEARKYIDAAAGMLTATAGYMGDQHARIWREGLRQVQLAFREASTVKDAPGSGPGEKYTGPVA